MKKILTTLAMVGVSATLVAAADTETRTIETGETAELRKFTGVTLEGGGDLTIHHGSEYKVENTGTNHAWNVEIDDGNLKLICPKPCKDKKLEATVTLPKLEALIIAGGGKMDVSGDFPDVEELAIVIVGGGYIDADAVPSDKAEVVITGGGHISVYAKDELDVSIIGGGQVRYKGDPDINKSILGGGLVSKN